MKHSSSVIRCDDIGTRCGDVGARRGDRAELLAISARSSRRYRRGVYGNIGDCGVGITPQMCNKVTNHGDMSPFSKPDEPLVKHHETLLKHCEASWNTLKTLCTITKHSPFNGDAETSPLGPATLALSAEISALMRSFRRCWLGVSSDISNCRVGITLQMCNRVTNHGDKGTFSKQVQKSYVATSPPPRARIMNKYENLIKIGPLSDISSFTQSAVTNSKIIRPSELQIYVYIFIWQYLEKKFHCLSRFY